MTLLTSVGSVVPNAYKLRRFVLRCINRIRNNAFGRGYSVPTPTNSHGTSKHFSPETNLN